MTAEKLWLLFYCRVDYRGEYVQRNIFDGLFRVFIYGLKCQS